MIRARPPLRLAGIVLLASVSCGPPPEADVPRQPVNDRLRDACPGKSDADMTNITNPGVWRYVFAVTKEGRHFATADGDGAVEAAVQVEFYALRKTRN